MSSRSLDDLLPCARDRVSKFLADAHKAGFGKLDILCTYRSLEEQAELYGHGRSKTKLLLARVNPKWSKPKLPVVTNAKPGQSMHNYKLAVDIRIDAYPQNYWDDIAHFARAQGLSWGGDWHTFKDWRHFEYIDGCSYTAIRAGKLPPK